MLSEERVKHMTNMALFEKKEAKDYMLAVKYNKKDYLTSQLALGFLFTTVFFGLGYLGIILAILGKTNHSIQTIGIVLLVLIGVLVYLILLYLNLLRVTRVATNKYNEGKRKLKKVITDLSILEEMYEEEEQSIMPDLSSEWDSE